MNRRLSHLSMLFFVVLLMQAGISLCLAQTAKDLSVGFSSRVYLSSGTALWNQALQVIQPTLIVKNWNSGGGNQTTAIDVGDGSHGSFDSSTWAHFGTVDTTNKIIYFDNATYSPLQATNFTLDAGWTLIPTKPQALKINVLGNATVNGVIECSGENGGNVTSSPGTIGSGGSGRCGGGDGGSGGAQRTGTGVGAWNADAGTSLSTGITGGTGGSITNGTGGAGGGGGGAFGSATPSPSLAAANGGNASATAGTLGTRHLDPAFTNLPDGGGAGGGGGSGSSSQAGAGGGGGGGVIVLHIGGNLVIGTNGGVFARGGNGGIAASDGGEGGSGGGGSIQTWIGKGINIQASTGNAIDATGGANTSGSASRGGDGWNGRTWTSTDTTASGYVTAGASISPAADISMNEGSSYYYNLTDYPVTPSQDVISTAIDTQSTMPVFNSATFTSTKDADVTLEIAGSNDAFVSDDTGWVAPTSIATLNNKRYFRFHLSIKNSDAVNGTTVSAIDINYTPGLRTDFDFKSAGCGQVTPKNGPPPWTGIFLLLPLVAFFKLRQRVKVRAKK